MNWFHMASIRARMMLVLGMIIAVLAMFTFLAAAATERLAGLTDKLYRHPMTVTNAILSVDGNIVRMHRSMKDVVLAKTPEELRKASDAVDLYEKHTYEQLAIVRKAFLGPVSMVDQIDRLIHEWKPIRSRVIAYKSEGELDAAVAITKTEGAAKVAAVAKAVEELKAWATDKGAAFVADAGRTSQDTLYTLVGVGVLAICVLASIFLLTLHSILRGVRQLQAAVEQLSSGQGDLTYRLPALGGELGPVGASLNAFVASLEGIIISVRGRAGAIADTSAQIADGNNSLSSRTEQQASSLEETASTMEQLTAAMRQTADHAGHANQLAIRASDVAGKGGTVVAQVVETMESINVSSHRIVEIIAVIDGIAFQTNILALNAAVEAARAGEQGRGFAVVASEVRNLAQRSASAAKEIKTLIDHSVGQIETGARMVEQAGATMTEIVASIERVKAIVGEIAQASQEQGSGIAQINVAITELDSVTQQNAAQVEEEAAATEALNQQAAGLVQIMGTFKAADTPRSGSVAVLQAVPHPARPSKPALLVQGGGRRRTAG